MTDFPSSSQRWSGSQTGATSFSPATVRDSTDEGSGDDLISEGDALEAVAFTNYVKHWLTGVEASLDAERKARSTATEKAA